MILNIAEEPDELFDRIEGITNFYKNEKLTYEKFNEWMHQNEAAALFPHISGKPKLYKGYFIALYHYFKGLFVPLGLLLLNYILLYTLFV